jgi:hypothetical protein
MSGALDSEMEWSQGTTIKFFRDSDVEVGEENTLRSLCHEVLSPSSWWGAIGNQKK